MLPFAFVVGCGRSGTTLVQSVMGSHPDLAVTHEARFVAALAPRRRRYERGTGFASDVFLADVIRCGALESLKLSPDEARQSLESNPPRSYADAVRQLFRLFADHEGKPRYGDKTPGYLVRLPLLASLFPEACFVHVIRDGRDTALAHLDRGFHAQDLAEVALNWKSRIKRGRRAGARLGPTRYCEIRYEDLLDDPEKALEPVCTLLGLAYDDQMLRYFERGDELLAETRHPQDFQNLRRPLTKGLRDWRTQMGAADIALFEAIAGDLLVDLGYERTTAANLQQGLIAKQRWLAWQKRRTLWHVNKLLQRSSVFA